MSAETATPLVFAVPMVVAALLAAVGRWLPRPVVDGLATAAAATVLGVCLLLLDATGTGRVTVWLGGWEPVAGESVGVVLSVDRFGAGLATLAAALVLAALVYSWRYFEAVEAFYHVLVLLFLAGMCGFAVSGDLFDMFVFFELMGACAYALTGFRIEASATVQGALHFGVVNSLGAYLSLTGIALLYARTGELGLAAIGDRLAGHRPDALVTVSFVLVIAGFLVKAAACPFHFWTADAEGVAPAPICALFSCAMVELGVYGVARTYWAVYSGSLAGAGVERALLVLGAVTALTGGLMCLQQHNLKRLLAYSTISHVGLFLLGVAILTPDGLAGAATYVAGHAGVKGALFLGTGIVLNRYGSVDVRDLHGAVRGTARWMAALFCVGGLGLAGLPPFGTFLGKSALEDALSSTGHDWAVGVAVLASALTAAAVLVATLRLLTRTGEPAGRPGSADRPVDPERERPDSEQEEQRETAQVLSRTPLTMSVPAVALLLASTAVSLWPAFGRAATAGAGDLVDRTALVAATLGTGRAPVTPEPPGTALAWTGHGIALALCSVALALAVAAARVWGHRLPGPARRIARVLLPRPGRVLARIHTEHLGDSVAWLLVGVVGVLLLVAV